MENLVEEIRSFFPEFRISVNDLKNPANSFVREFYCRVLMELGVDIDNVRKVQMEQLDAQEIDIIPELNLVTAIRKVFPFIKFRLYDLLSPDVKRNASQISQVMHFLQFCESRLANNNEKVNKFQEVKNEEREIAKLKDKETILLNNLVCELDSCRQAKQELEQNISKLKPEVEKRKEAVDELREEYKEAEEVYNSKGDKLQSLSREIQAIEIEIEELRKLIVANPNEVQRNFDVKYQERERVKESKMEFQERYKAHRDVLEKLQKRVEDLNRELAPILDDLHIIKEYSEVKNSNTKAEETMEQFQKRKEELTKNIKEFDKKKSNEENAHSEKLSDLKKEESLVAKSLVEKESEFKKILKESKKEETKCQQELQNALTCISTLEEDYRTTILIFSQVVRKLDAVRESRDL